MVVVVVVLIDLSEWLLDFTRRFFFFFFLASCLVSKPPSRRKHWTLDKVTGEKDDKTGDRQTVELQSKKWEWEGEKRKRGRDSTSSPSGSQQSVAVSNNTNKKQPTRLRGENKQDQPDCAGMGGPWNEEWTIDGLCLFGFLAFPRSPVVGMRILQSSSVSLRLQYGCCFYVQLAYSHFSYNNWHPKCDG